MSARRLAVAAALMLAAATQSPAVSQAAEPTGDFIVLYRGAGADLTATPGITVTHRYSAAAHGFAATMTEATARKLAADPAVASVERDRPVTLTTTQPNPPNWGLDRIDQSYLPLDAAYTFTHGGAGVRAYVIDTGIRVTHVDFGGRAVWGVNTTGDGQSADCNGHGTHLAGIVGGGAMGVAKSVRLVAVKVIPCGIPGGTISQAMAGVDWVTTEHRRSGVPASVAVLGVSVTPASTALDNAVANSINAGVYYSVPAGNAGANACFFSPARVPYAITVAAVARTDVRPSWSNFGPCLDLFAPGVEVRSTWYASDFATNELSGTSQAAAFVAGVVAKYISMYGTQPPVNLLQSLILAATPNVVIDPGPGSPNRLLRTTW